MRFERLTKHEIMVGERYDTAKLIARNTVVFTIGGVRVIRYCKTNVLTFQENGNLTFNTGGYMTSTTKRRLNGFQSRCEIFQRDSQWYFESEFDKGIFYDGLTLDRNGCELNSCMLKGVIMKVLNVKRNQLTSECWVVQFEGLSACKNCPAQNTKECGGMGIVLSGKNKKGFKVPLVKNS